MSRFLMVLFLVLFGVAPNAQAGHDQGEPSFNLLPACDNIPSIVGIIEASKTDSAFEFFQGQMMQGRCKEFTPQRPLAFWFEKVVRDDLVWSDGDLMYVIQGHDRSGFPLFTWGTARAAHQRGWYPGGDPT